CLETCTYGSGKGGWKRSRKATSPAAYSTGKAFEPPSGGVIARAWGVSRGPTHLNPPWAPPQLRAMPGVGAAPRVEREERGIGIRPPGADAPGSCNDARSA